MTEVRDFMFSLYFRWIGLGYTPGVMLYPTGLCLICVAYTNNVKFKYNILLVNVVIVKVNKLSTV